MDELYQFFLHSFIHFSLSLSSFDSSFGSCLCSPWSSLHGKTLCCCFWCLWEEDDDKQKNYYKRPPASQKNYVCRMKIRKKKKTVSILDFSFFHSTLYSGVENDFSHYIRNIKYTHLSHQGFKGISYSSL